MNLEPSSSEDSVQEIQLFQTYEDLVNDELAGDRDLARVKDAVESSSCVHDIVFSFRFQNT